MSAPTSAPTAAIRTPDQRLRVFVSSTLGELAAERAAARAAVEQLRLAPILFELGARPHPPRALYRAYLEQSDVFVGIYWQRYGWVAPDMDISGLEDELRLSEGMPRLLYVKRPAPEMEPGLRRLLDEVQDQGTTSYRPFSDPEELRQLLLDDLALLLTERFSAPAPPASGVAPVPRQRIPAPTTRLIGRDADVADVAALLCDRGCRLVTVTGTGGIGKTRLALAVAERTASFWTDGTVFADLSSVADPSLVPTAVAAAAGAVAEGIEEPLDAVVHRFADRHLLLVLDNFEHVLDAAPAVAHLLAHCPRVQVLATSRCALHLRGEQEHPLAPLDLAPEDADESALCAAGAGQLFLDRAREVRPNLTLTPDGVAAVTALCRRLDGLPLALELAAARLRLLTPGQVLDRLGACLDLTGSFADLPERQRTLTATLDWSHGLLDGDVQRAFARLSVFSGPFTLDGAEAVCGADIDALTALSALVDHSLLVPAQRPNGEPAFRMLETVRSYASGRLDRLGERDDALTGLERYLIGAFAAAAPRLHGPEQAQVLLTLDGEAADLQATIGWLLRSGRPPGPLLHAVSRIWVWAQVRGHLRPLPDVLAVLGDAAAVGLSDSDIATLLWMHAGGLISSSRFEEVLEFLNRFLPSIREFAEPGEAGLMLTVRALSRPYEPDTAAWTEFPEAEQVLRGTGDVVGLGYTLAHHGDLLLVSGDVDRARALHGEALDIGRQVGDVNLTAEAEYCLALDDLAAGDPASAARRLVPAVRRYRDIEHRDGLARCLVALAGLQLAQGDPAAAARALGVAAAVREPIGIRPWPLVAEVERRIVADVRAALGAAFESEFGAGRGGDAVQTLERGLRLDRAD